MGILSKIFGRPPRRSTAKSMSAADIEKILKAYGAATASGESLYRDVSELPYPKPVIKEALILALCVTKDPKDLNLLRSGFVMLADWQEGLNALGPDPFLQGSSDGDVWASAKRIVERGQPFMELKKRAVAEGKALLDELNALGLNGPSP
jgi:hypothetical protein